MAAAIAVALLAGLLASPPVPPSKRDQVAIDAVLRDLLTIGDSPLAAGGLPPKGFSFAPESLATVPSVDEVLYQHSPEPWRKLTPTQSTELREAAADLVARTQGRRGFSRFHPSDARVRVYLAAKPEKAERSPSDERVVRAWPPGFSKDGSLAVVRLSMPWSGMHHAGATYVLCQAPGGWVICVREFVYYP